MRDGELERGIDRAELYASNVDRKIETRESVCMCVGGRGGYVCLANSVT